jgi:hypothetical protein
MFKKKHLRAKTFKDRSTKIRIECVLKLPILKASVDIAEFLYRALKTISVRAQSIGHDTSKLAYSNPTLPYTTSLPSDGLVRTKMGRIGREHLQPTDVRL